MSICSMVSSCRPSHTSLHSKLVRFGSPAVKSSVSAGRPAPSIRARGRRPRSSAGAPHVQEEDAAAQDALHARAGREQESVGNTRAVRRSTRIVAGGHPGPSALPLAPWHVRSLPSGECSVAPVPSSAQSAPPRGPPHAIAPASTPPRLPRGRGPRPRPPHPAPAGAARGFTNTADRAPAIGAAAHLARDRRSGKVAFGIALAARLVLVLKAPEQAAAAKVPLPTPDHALEHLPHPSAEEEARQRQEFTTSTPAAFRIRPPSARPFATCATWWSRTSKPTAGPAATASSGCSRTWPASSVGEALSIEWSRVDRDIGVIRLEMGETKSSESRTLRYGARDRSR
jgi:hypothetical protein